MEKDRTLWKGEYCALYKSKDGYLHLGVSDGVDYVGAETHGLAELLKVLQEHQDLLKPKPVELEAKCPFCGTKLRYLNMRGINGRYAVCCEVCGIRGPLGDTANLAIQGWNKAFKK